MNQSTKISAAIAASAAFIPAEALAVAVPPPEGGGPAGIFSFIWTMVLGVLAVCFLIGMWNSRHGGQ